MKLQNILLLVAIAVSVIASVILTGCKTLPPNTGLWVWRTGAMVLTKEGVIDKAKDPDAAAARLYDVALAIEGLTVSPREATPELFRTSVYNLVKDNVWGRIFAEDLAAFYEDAYNEAVSSGDFSKLGRVCHALAGGVRRAAELHLASAASER